MRIHSGAKRYHLRSTGNISLKEHYDKGLPKVNFDHLSLGVSGNNIFFLDRRDAEQVLTEIKKQKERMIYQQVYSIACLSFRVVSDNRETFEHFWSRGYSELIEHGVRELDVIIEEEDEPNSRVTELTSQGGLREALDSYLKSNDEHALFHLNFPSYMEFYERGRILSESGAMMGFNKKKYSGIEEVEVNLSLPTDSYFMEAMILSADNKSFMVFTPTGIPFSEAFKRMHTPLDKIVTFKKGESYFGGDKESVCIKQPHKMFIDGDRYIWLNAMNNRVNGESGFTFVVTEDRNYTSVFKTPGFSGVQKGFCFGFKSYETLHEMGGFKIYDVDAGSTQQFLSRLEELTRNTADYLRRIYLKDRTKS